MAQLANAAKPGFYYEVLSNPEFLAEGTAIHNLLEPDRIIIGMESTFGGQVSMGKLAGIYAQWVPRERIITCSNATAELSKLIANAMLAQRVSSINAASAMCEAFDADVGDVSRICATDPRIGPAMLNSSLGFGGSCFGKDVRCLVYLAEVKGLTVVAEYWKSVIALNVDQQTRFLARILDTMQPFGMIHYAVLGLTYKKNTNDTRTSPALHLVRTLLDAGHEVALYDPVVSHDRMIEDVFAHDDLPHVLMAKLYPCRTAEEACHGAHAIIIATNWDEFSNQKQPEEAPDPAGLTPPSHMPLDAQLAVELAPDRPYRGSRLDWTRVSMFTEEPHVVFDGHHMLDAAPLEALGMRVESVGITSKSKPWP